MPIWHKAGGSESATAGARSGAKTRGGRGGQAMLRSQQDSARVAGRGRLKRNLLLSASVLAGTLASYGRGAQAQQVCEPAGGFTYVCSGASGDTQVITRDNATVSTENPLVVTTTASGADAISITGDGALSFVDPQSSNTVLTGSARGLYMRAAGDAGDVAGSIAIDTAATIESYRSAIAALNYGSGATTVTANGDLTSTARSGIFARNGATATDLSITTGANSTISSAFASIYARGYGTGSTSITADGDLSSGREGIDVVNGTNATNLTVTTGAGASISSAYDGIQAKNYGTGATSITVGGDLSSNREGVDVVNGENATDLTVTTGVDSTVYTASTAIAVENKGTGSTTLIIDGEVGSAYRTAIFAQNGDTAGDLTVTTGAGSTVTGFSNGISLYNAGIGDTTVVAGGDVTGRYASGFSSSQGIFASDGNYADDMTVRTLAGTTVSGADRGIFVGNSGTGAATVVADGDVAGGKGAGIEVTNAFESDTTDLSVTTSGDVTGNGGGGKYGFQGGFSGISTLNFGSGSTTINVTGGTVTAAGPQGDGIYAVNSQEATDLSVTTAAGTTVSGAYNGIRAENTGTGVTTITVGGDVTGRTRDGIKTSSDNDAAKPVLITVLSSGSVQSQGTDADDFGIDIQDSAGDVTVAGMVTGGAGGAIHFDADEAFDDRLELQPGFAITGRVDAGLGADSFVLGGPAGAGGGVDASLDIGLVSGDGVADAAEQYLGFNSFTKEDGSTFELTGSNDEIDAFRVEGGGLLVNAAMRNTDFSVEDGAKLGGNGMVGSLVAQSGATIAPGDIGEIGTLDIAGNVRFADGSAFQADVAADGTSDLIVADTTRIEGGTVALVARDPAGLYRDGQQSVIIDTANGRAGTFDDTTDDVGSIFIDFDLLYTEAQVILEADVTAFADVAKTVNQRNAASALDAFDRTVGSDALFVRNEFLDLASFEEARHAFDLASGEIHAGVQHALAGSGTLFAETLRRRAGVLAGTDLPGSAPQGYQQESEPAGHSPFALAADMPEGPVADYARERTVGAWAAVYGQTNELEGDGGRGFGAAELDWQGAGVAGGVEGEVDGLFGDLSDGLLVGIAAGYSETDAEVAARLSRADITSGHIGFYTASRLGPLQLALASSYSWHEVETVRDIRFGAIDRTAEADYSAGTFASSGEASLPFQSGGFTVAPLVTYNVAWVNRDGFTEDGASALDLASGDEDFTTAGIGAGVALGYEVALGGALVRSDLRLTYQHGFGDDRPRSVNTLAGAPDTPFEVVGAEAAEDRLAVGAGLGVSLSEALSASLGYDGAFGDGSESHRGHVSVGYRF